MCHIYDTPHRFLLRTDIKVRAKRRAEQLVRLGKPGDLDTIEKSIKARDLADETRKVNPFRPHLEAMMIDTTSSTVAEVANIIINVYRTPQPRKESGRKTALVQ
jgi:cytidylate kinase